jgi:hypothetical protein
MSSEAPVDAPKAAEGAQEVTLPVQLKNEEKKEKKEKKDKAPKASKTAGIEVREPQGTLGIAKLTRYSLIVAARKARVHSAPIGRLRQDQGQARRGDCWCVLMLPLRVHPETHIAIAKPREEITVSLPNGKEEKGTSWETTPLAIAKGISKSLVERTIISTVDGELWDLTRPLEKSCKLELLDFENVEAKKVFWHSSAHILGEAAERRFGCYLCNGPPTTDPPGFYYDMANMAGQVVADEDKKALETLSSSIIKEKQPFVRLEMTKDELLEMFKYSQYKEYFINQRVPDGTLSTVYRCGPLIDLCRGPHVPNTGNIKAFAVLRVRFPQTVLSRYGYEFADRVS